MGLGFDCNNSGRNLCFSFFSLSFFSLYSDIPNGSEYSSITNENGVAEYSYNATGIGDIIIQGSIDGIENNILIEDCDWWDNGTVNRLSEYNSLIEGTGSFNYSDGAYNWSNLGNYRDIFQIPVNGYITPFIFEIDINVIDGQSFEYGITIFESFSNGRLYNTLELMQYNNQRGFGKYGNNSWSDGGVVNNAPTINNQWIRFRMIVNNGTVRGEIINLETEDILYDRTINYDALKSNLKYGLICKYAKQYTGKFKNIKLKKLTS